MRIIKFHWCPICNREWDMLPERMYCPKCYTKLLVKTKDLDISW